MGPSAAEVRTASPSSFLSFSNSPQPLKTLVLRHFLPEKMGRGRGKWKTGQQLCRKVCNSVKGSCKCPVYKGFRDWFRGLLGHETRAMKRSVYGWKSGGEKGGKGEGKGKIPEGFLAWLAERRAKIIICKSAKMKFARTDENAGSLCLCGFPAFYFVGGSILVLKSITMVLTNEKFSMPHTGA